MSFKELISEFLVTHACMFAMLPSHFFTPQVFLLSIQHNYSSLFSCLGLAASSTPPMQMSPHPLPNIGIQLECFVSYALTPNKFYIQLVSDSTLSVNYFSSWQLQPTTQLEKLMMELQDYANERHPLMTLPSPGTPCLAQFSLDQVWYRAVVTSEGLLWQYLLMMVVMVTRHRG